jgi:chemotaxis protein CheC
MQIHDYSELDSLQLDALREIGSIGSGNAANAPSAMIGRQVRLQKPQVRIMGYDEAIDWIGGPEEITAGVLVKLSGDLTGIMLSVQQLPFINLVMDSMLGMHVEDYHGIGEVERSAMTEVGNIMISNCINAICSLAGMEVNLTVPAFTVDMQGAIMAVPMAEFGGQSDYIMTIGGDFICDNKMVPCHMMLSPDIESLNALLRKLGVED